MKEISFKVFNANGEQTHSTTDRESVYEMFATTLVHHREYKSEIIYSLKRSTDYLNGGHVFTFYLSDGYKYVFDMDI